MTLGRVMRARDRDLVRRAPTAPRQSGPPRPGRTQSLLDAHRRSIPARSIHLFSFCRSAASNELL
jgi:hypothetical protein